MTRLHRAAKTFSLIVAAARRVEAGQRRAPPLQRRIMKDINRREAGSGGTKK
jgi:hypothetical protein